MLRGFFKFQADYTHSKVHEYGNKKYLSAAAYFSPLENIVCALYVMRDKGEHNIRFAHTNGFSILRAQKCTLGLLVWPVFTPTRLYVEKHKIYSTKS